MGYPVWFEKKAMKLLSTWILEIIIMWKSDCFLLSDWFASTVNDNQLDLHNSNKVFVCEIFV